MELLQLSQTNKPLRLKSYIIMLIMIFALLGANQVAVRANDDMNLEQVLLGAVEESNELADERRAVISLEREIAKLKANLGWQYDLKLSYNRGEQVQLSDDRTDEPVESLGTQERYNISIGGGRSFLFGLNLTTDLTVIDSQDLNFDDLRDDWQLDLGANLRLWPRTPSDFEKNIDKLENNLALARLELEEAEGEFFLELAGDYIEIIFLEKRQENNLENLEIAERRLARIEQRKEISEAGELELAEARLALRQVDRAYQSTERNLGRLKTDFEKKVAINVEIDYGLIDQAEELLIEGKDSIDNRIENYLANFSEVIRDSQVNSLEYSRLIQSLSEAEQELEWHDNEDSFEINLSATTEVNSGSWQAGFNISYPLYDGGFKGYEREELVAEIEIVNLNLEEFIFNLEQGLEAELDGLIIKLDELEDKEIEKEMSRLSFLQEEEAREIGAIDELELLEAELDYEAAIIDYDEARLELAIDLLKFEQRPGYWSMEESLNE